MEHPVSREHPVSFKQYREPVELGARSLAFGVRQPSPPSTLHSSEYAMTLRPTRWGMPMAALLIATAESAGQGTSPASRPTSPTTPSPPHERLAAFEGTWTKSGSASDRASRDTCAWLAGGRRHMICRRATRSSAGTQEQMMIYSYRRSDSTYTVTALLSGGQVWNYAGRPEGDRWVFYLANTRPDAPQRLRQVIAASTDTLHFVEEVSDNGGPWRLTDASEDYKYVRTGKTPP